MISDGEGAGAAAEDSVEVVIGLLQGRDDATAIHPDKGGKEEVPRKLLRQLAAQVVLAGHRKIRGIQDFGGKKIWKFDQWKTFLPAKTPWVKPGGCQKLPQPGKDQ
jgi:hypothetical protein